MVGHPVITSKLEERPTDKRLLLSALCGAVALTLASAAHAVTDPTGDFLPGYRGSHNGDLDVVSADATYNSGTHLFDFTAMLNAPVATTSSAFHVWGLDRGAGVKFDTVVIFRLDGTATIGATVLAHDVSFSGNTVTGSVPDALLPSMGLAFDDYGRNLWPRDGTVTSNAAISDFAPDASDGAVTAVPEPASFAMLGLDLGLMGAVARRRRAG